MIQEKDTCNKIPVEEEWKNPLVKDYYAFMTALLYVACNFTNGSKHKLSQNEWSGSIFFFILCNNKWLLSSLKLRNKPTSMCDAVIFYSNLFKDETIHQLHDWGNPTSIMVHSSLHLLSPDSNVILTRTTLSPAIANNICGYIKLIIHSFHPCLFVNLCCSQLWSLILGTFLWLLWSNKPHSISIVAITCTVM